MTTAQTLEWLRVYVLLSIGAYGRNQEGFGIYELLKEALSQKKVLEETTQDIDKSRL